MNQDTRRSTSRWMQALIWLGASSVLLGCQPWTELVPPETPEHIYTFSAKDFTTLEAELAKAHLSCAESDSCPENVGLIYANYNSSEHGEAISQCTGFLLSENIVATAGHCLPEKIQQGGSCRKDLAIRFLPKNASSSATRPSRDSRLTVKESRDIFSCVRVLSFKDQVAPNADFAFFEIEPSGRRALDMELGPLVDESPLKTWKMTPLFLYQEQNKIAHLQTGAHGAVLQTANCRLILHSVLNPLAVHAWPESALAFECGPLPGESGSPVVDGDGRVIGITQTYAEHPAETEDGLRMDPGLYQELDSKLGSEPRQASDREQEAVKSAEQDSMLADGNSSVTQGGRPASENILGQRHFPLHTVFTNLTCLDLPGNLNDIHEQSIKLRAYEEYQRTGRIEAPTFYDQAERLRLCGQAATLDAGSCRLNELSKLSEQADSWYLNWKTQLPAVFLYEFRNRAEDSAVEARPFCVIEPDDLSPFQVEKYFIQAGVWPLQRTRLTTDLHEIFAVESNYRFDSYMRLSMDILLRVRLMGFASYRLDLTRRGWEGARFGRDAPLADGWAKRGQVEVILPTCTAEQLQTGHIEEETPDNSIDFLKAPPDYDMDLICGISAVRPPPEG